MRINKDASIDYSSSPYPWFVVDRVLADADWKDLLANWPSDEQFEENVGFGRNSLRMQYDAAWNVLTAAQRDFWKEFLRTIAAPLIRASLLQFSSLIFNRFGFLANEVVLQNFQLAQLFQRQLPIPVHAHHFHSPLLTGTGIFYVDDHGHTERGTRLYRAKKEFSGIDSLAAIEARHRSLETDPSCVEIAEVVDFSPNRALILSDGPTAWHDVADAGDIEGPRRQVLFNWGMPFDRCPMLYGVDLDRYMKVREEEQGSAQSVSWISRDIRQERIGPPLTEEQAKTFAGLIKIRGHAALDVI